ncbi:hypothetical protein ACWAT4_04145 [Bradyrhizobium manausense]
MARFVIVIFQISSTESIVKIRSLWRAVAAGATDHLPTVTQACAFFRHSASRRLGASFAA